MEPILLKPEAGVQPPEDPVLLYPYGPDSKSRAANTPDLVWLHPAPQEPERNGPGVAVRDEPEEKAGGTADAIAVACSVPPTTPLERRASVRVVAQGLARAVSWVFGAATLILGLSVLVAVPIVQFLTLGYLFEAEGRVARTGRIREGFPGVRVAARIGGMVLGCWIVLVPWSITGVLAADAALIDPASAQTVNLERLWLALAVVTPVHLVLALSRGGRLRYFFRPLQNGIWFVRRLAAGGYFREAWGSMVKFWRDLRLAHYFSLGLRGFLATGIWLVVPTTLIALGRRNGVAILGVLLLWIVLMYLPFLQAHFTAENRFRAMFQIGAVRQRLARAPIAFLVAFVWTLILALPLYLLKVEVVPRDALWLPAMLFIVTIFPMKILTGWAYGRAGRRQERGHFLIRFPCRLLMIPVALFYALVVFLTQYTGWHGVLSLYEHHAFLLPVPF